MPDTRRAVTLAAITALIEPLTPSVKSYLSSFWTGAMSYGSISLEAHKDIAEAVNTMAMLIHGVDSPEGLAKLGLDQGPFSNSGEGGELQERNNTIHQSWVHQFASGNFGVNANYLSFLRWAQTKFNQGAKPGFGGKLPGKDDPVTGKKSKVTPAIAKARFVEPNTTLESPSALHDQYSIEDHKQKNYDMYSGNPNAGVSVKIAADHRVGPVGVGAVKAGAMNVSVAGPGGTGAVQTTAKYDFCHPWEFAVHTMFSELTKQGYGSIPITASGGMQTAEDCAKAYLLGARFIEIGTLVLIMLGCIKADKCHTGECPAGIATQDQKLIDAKYRGKPEHIAVLLVNLAKGIDSILAPYGITCPADAVGRTDLLSVNKDSPFKGLESLLVVPVNPYPNFKPRPRPLGSSEAENAMIAAIREGQREFVFPALNTTSSFGARTSYYVETDPSFKAFFEGPIEVRFNGVSMGQSFGFVAPLNLQLVAKRSNDGTGRCLDGADIFVTDAIGDSAFYGATRGRGFVRTAGARFAVRNSGGRLVAGEIGDMGANFMTGGVLALPGAFGPNFGAGFSGGVVYLLKTFYYQGIDCKFIADDTLAMTPQELSADDIQVLGELFAAYLEKISHRELRALLQTEDWPTKFIRLDPKHLQAELPKPVETMPAEAMAADEPLDEATLPLNPPIGDEEAVLEQLPVVPILEFAEQREKNDCGVALLMQKDKISSYRTTNDVLTMLARLAHRGFVGIDPDTGDGCGISWYGLTEFFRVQFPALDLKAGAYCVVPMYVSQDETVQEEVIALFHQLLEKEGLSVAGRRSVLNDPTRIGEIGRALQSPLEQFVVLKPADCSPDEFELKLVRVRLQFELTMQLRTDEARPHILSSSPHFVTYTSLATVENFRYYFLDFVDPAFQAFGGVVHTRAATNTKTRVENIQPLGNFANNGENNALQILIDFLEKNPLVKTKLGLDNIDLHGLSDSNVMSIYMDILQLCGYTPLQIIESAFHPYIPTGNSSTQFSELFSLPFVGPCAGILMMNNQLIAVKDRNSFRPAVGIENDDYISLGSEWGIVEGDGETLRLSAGQPYLIDLNHDKLTIHKHQPESGVMLHDRPEFQLERSGKTEPDNVAALRQNPKELQLRKARAGWNKQTQISHLDPLLQKKARDESMADQSPLEATVSDVELGSLFKGNFAQITNPPLAAGQEKLYMTKEVFLGRKPAPDKITEEKPVGVIVSSPALDNETMADVMASRTLNAVVFDITYDYGDGKKEHLDAAKARVIQAVVDAVQEGTICVVLSDCNATHGYVPIHPPLIASEVHDALLRAGIRHQTALIVQVSQVFGRDAAQDISIGGVDAFNFYLPYLLVPNAENYAESLYQEVLNHMSRLGNPSISAYRGSKDFVSIGLDADIAALYGVPTVVGGIGWDAYMQIIGNAYFLPNHEGSGKYAREGDSKIWRPEVVMNTIEAARTGDVAAFNRMQASANELKRGYPRGWLDFKPSRHWNDANPLPVCILGGGAAAFYQVQSLLDSHIPVVITVIERSLANRFGLLGDGVAPDHLATKQQQALLRECLNDKRVSYHGGVEVTPQLYEELVENYPCIIDCRGASVDIKLGIPGEDLPGVLSGSTVYKAYNNVFNPSDTNTWPFAISRNKTICIVGIGNVAADIARLLLSDPSTLEHTSMNKQFLQELRHNQPNIIHICARGNPGNAKVNLKSLLELRELGFGITADFNSNAFDRDSLTAEQAAVVQFFDSIRSADVNDHRKRIHFHFQVVPKEFVNTPAGIEVKLNNGETIIARNVVTAIGTKPVKSDCDYVTGWAAGKGGTLNLASTSANETTLQIEQDFDNQVFHGKKGPEGSHNWELRTRVTNDGLLSILRYIEDGKRLLTNTDFLRALHYGQARVHIEPVMSGPVDELPLSQPGKITVRDAKGEVHTLTPKPGNLLTFFRTELGTSAPKGECDGEEICGTCTVQAPESIPRSSKESRLLKLKGKDPSFFALACAHRIGTTKKACAGGEVDIEDLGKGFAPMNDFDDTVSRTGMSFNISSIE